jgi:hypothetical protein
MKMRTFLCGTLVTGLLAEGTIPADHRKVHIDIEIPAYFHVSPIDPIVVTASTGSATNFVKAM